MSEWVYGLRTCFTPRGKTHPQLFTVKKAEGVFYPRGKTRPHLYLWGVGVRNGVYSGMAPEGSHSRERAWGFGSRRAEGV